jgi:hypothetical protein
MTEDSAKAKQTAKLTTPTGLGENAPKDISESPERRPMTPRPSMRQWKPRARAAGSRPATLADARRGSASHPGGGRQGAAGRLAVRRKTITSQTSLGISRECSPEVESAAQAELPVACIAAR